ncbi:hypothetical protein N7522_008780 [Penicillium canescens]|nr:hypothetical protein N7522_008780 [Penicillium canescens]
MNPVSPWLAALAEQCLSFYLGRNSQDGIEVEDLEGCLSFSMRGLVMSAIIDKWGQGDGDRATLTDSKNQIDAIFSRDSLNEHEASSPCPPTIKEGPKKQLIELLDVRLALMYSTNSPEIELRVNRFRIRWNQVTKGEPPKPKLKKTPAIKVLLKEACQKTQKSSLDARPNGQEDIALAEPSISQFDQPASPDSQFESMGSQFFSQVLSNTIHDAQRDHYKRSHVSLNKDAILGLLRPSAGLIHTRTETPSLPLGSSNSTQSALPDGKTPIESGEHPSYRPSSTLAEAECPDTPDSNAPRPNTSQDIVGPAVIERQSASSSIDLVDRDETVNREEQKKDDVLKKRQRDSTDAPSLTSRDGTDSQRLRKPGITSSSNKRQRTDTGEMTQVDLNETKEIRNEPGPEPVLSELLNLPTHQLLPDPWDGMTKIPTSDVHIPKEQADLFEPLVWIQQGSGESTPLCHVPPRLLTRWNDIAQKRKLLAKEDQRGGNPTPTSQDINRSGSVAESETGSQRSEPLSPWPDSPERHPGKILPPNTPPPSKSRNIREGATPSGTQSSAYQTAEDGDVDMVNESRATSQPAPEVVPSRSILDVVAQRASQYPEDSTMILKEAESRSQNPGDAPSQEHNHSDPSIEIEEQTPNPIQEPRDGRRSECPPAAPESHQPESSGDESDETDMETSVPCALGASIPPSSQPEQQVDSSGNSSGLSLPRSIRKSVQVVEMPAVQMTPSHREKQGNKTVNPEHSSSQQPSSQAAKTSSQSRILATYRSQESNTQSDPSQEALNPSLPVEDESLRVDVLGTQTQTSSSHPTSQETPQSHTEVVLDSSKTAQHQWDSCLFSSQPSANSSSFPFASFHPQPMSQLNGPSQNYMGELTSLDGATYFPDTSLGDSSGWTAPDAESPSKPPKIRQIEGTDTMTAFQSPNGGLVARRQSFIDKPDQTAQAFMFYEKFCNDYPPYSGGFAHFTEMCAKLQALREKGALQRSFLWDDFVILHLEEYQRHVEDCASQDFKTLKYEDFFCSSFARPRHKKRSLTTRAVNVAASQFVPPDTTTSSSQPPPCPVATQGERAHLSFTASLVDRLSDLHTRSFNNASANDTPNSPSTKRDMFPATQHSPLHPSGTLPTVQVKLEPDSSSNEVMDTQAHTMSSSGQRPVLSSSDQNMDDSMQHDEDDTQIKPGLSDVDMTEADESQGADRTHHRTASIELGDNTEDRHSSLISPPASTQAVAEVAASTDDVQQVPPRPRPWFRSLRNIFPAGPVWSDDPNTPFKRWAREDQNVLQELNRRGGAKIQLDDKGVICRPTYKREKGPGSL